MIEALLVLPLILFVLSLVVYFGFAMERMQRGMMIDRYEAWRGSAKAPGPATGINANSSTDELRDTFFAGDDPTLRFEPSDFFPSEPSNALQELAAAESVEAGQLSDQYYQQFPRGRSMRRLYEARRTVASARSMRLLSSPVRAASICASAPSTSPDFARSSTVPASAWMAR